MDTTLISRNAARLWKLMNNGAAWSYDKLKRATRLPDHELNAAIGWLAREDTIEITLHPETREDVYRTRHLWEGAL